MITWEAKKEAIFEMPTGGAAAMRQGPNLLKLSRKEQCLALLTQLRNKFKLNGQIYRVFPNGEVQYLHPKDGQYPEKVTPGRNAVNTNDRRIGDNTNPIKVFPYNGQLQYAPCGGCPALNSCMLVRHSMLVGIESRRITRTSLACLPAKVVWANNNHSPAIIAGLVDHISVHALICMLAG